MRRFSCTCQRATSACSTAAISCGSFSCNSPDFCSNPQSPSNALYAPAFHSPGRSLHPFSAIFPPWTTTASVPTTDAPEFSPSFARLPPLPSCEDISVAGGVCPTVSLVGKRSAASKLGWEAAAVVTSWQAAIARCGSDSAASGLKAKWNACCSFVSVSEPASAV